MALEEYNRDKWKIVASRMGPFPAAACRQRAKTLKLM
jgi:hypothetical protein